MEAFTLLPPIAAFLSPKRIVREKLLAERRAAAANRPDAAVHAAKNFIQAIAPGDDGVVSLYHPIKDELDTAPLADALIERGATLALPVIERRNAPLIFRRYVPGDELIKGGFGTLTPGPDADIVRPDIVVTPLLGFTREGGRLGYGGGYYDRTLQALRAKGAVLAVGYGFGAQEVDALPLSPLDQPLDWVVTERGAFKI